MFLAQEEIEKVLRSIPSHQRVMGLMAPQEVTRVAAICYWVLEQNLLDLEDQMHNNPAMWAAKVKPAIMEELKNTQDFFGISNIQQRLDLDAFLQKFAETETQIFHEAASQSQNQIQ